MHDIDRTSAEFEPETDFFETNQFEVSDGSEFETDMETDMESPFNEVEELDLAAELLSVSNEQELDQFIGNVFKRVLRGVKKAGSLIGKSPLGGVLKGLAKKALPFVGGALGSLIPIPGVGTAVGSALGGALSKALETELENFAPDERELEMARRFVRLAGSAAKQIAAAPPDVNPAAAARQATIAAARYHVPSLKATATNAGTGGPRFGVPGRSGRWIRRGRKIILLGV